MVAHPLNAFSSLLNQRSCQGILVWHRGCRYLGIVGLGSGFAWFTRWRLGLDQILWRNWLGGLPKRTGIFDIVYDPDRLETEGAFPSLKRVPLTSGACPWTELALWLVNLLREDDNHLKRSPFVAEIDTGLHLMNNNAPMSPTGLISGSMLPGHEDREIKPAPRAVPDDVLCYPQADFWRDRVWSLLEDLITDEVKALFVTAPPGHVVSDDLSWLDDLIFQATGQETNIKEEAASRLRIHYRAFRAAHATRTDDLGQFYDRGLRYLRPKEMEDRARTLLLNGQAEGASEESLQAAIDDLGARDERKGRTGRLYFCAVEEDLYSDCGGSGHYLTYGGEYLYCLAIRAAWESSAQRILKGLGSPTLFVCDIPMHFIDDPTMQEFAGMMLEYLFCELVEDMESDSLSPGSGSALTIQADLPADCIVGHYHPAKIYDPLRYR